MNHFFKATIFFLAALFWSSIAFAQQEPHFSQYMFSNLYFNPAYAGITDQPEISLIARTQWLGYQATGSGSNDLLDGGQPNSQVLNASLPFRKIHGGLGLTLLNDKLGPIQNVKAGLSYSYIMKVGQGKLGIGIRGGFYNSRIDGSKYKYQNPDPLIPSGTVSQTKPDIDGGLWYKTDNFYAGLGVTNLNNPKFSYDIASAAGTLTQHAYLTAAYTFRVNYAIEFIPSTLVKTDFKLKGSTFDINGTFKFHEKYWVGAMYRLQDAAGIMAGISLLKDNSLRVGYALDLTVTGNKAKNTTSHEFMLAYVFPPKVNLPKPIIRTPRYRFN